MLHGDNFESDYWIDKSNNIRNPAWVNLFVRKIFFLEHTVFEHDFLEQFFLLEHDFM